MKYCKCNYQYHLCDNYFCTYFLHWCVVFHWNKTETVQLLFCGKQWLGTRYICSSYATASVLSLGHYGFRGGASLQIENAQLKLHFSPCMLVLLIEWMNILQPTLCVILFHAFESSIIFEKPSFYGLSGRPRAVDRFPKGHCFGWLSSNSSYRRKWWRTRLKLYSQSEERTLFRAVYELFWCGLWKQRNGGKYGCCNFFLKYFVKIGRLGKKFTHRCVLLSTRACISLVVLLKNTTVMGLKRWRCGKKISQTQPAHRVGSSDSRSSEMEET